MPIFEYECIRCGDKFEELVMKNSDDVHCPKCNGTDVNKRLSAFGMKSGGRFEPSSGPACSSCSGSDCSTCA